MGWLLLAVNGCGAASVLIALTGPRKPALASVMYFLMGWLTAEFTVVQVGIQAIATVLVVALAGVEGWPGWTGIALGIASIPGIVVLERRKPRVAAPVDAALREWHLAGPASSVLTAEVRRRARGNPLLRRSADLEVSRGLAYGPYGKRNQLDVYRRPGAPAPAPVLVYVHGGAWVLGSKDHQGQPLMLEMARRGWVCVAPNYRLSPNATFPDHLVDVKRAIVWAREHAADYGADTGFVAIAGGSAGGHLAALAALTVGDLGYEPGFEHADTSVSACVAAYGCFDFCDSRGIRGRWADMERFVRRDILKCDRATHHAEWEAASPIFRVRPDAPPFLVLHGTHDPLLWIEESRAFAESLAGVSTAPVCFLAVPHANHAFDAFFTLPSLLLVQSMARWLEGVRDGIVAAPGPRADT